MVATSSELERKTPSVASLYRFSGLSVEGIAWQLDMKTNHVQRIIDDLTKKDALEVLVEHYNTTVEAIMTTKVISLDYSMTAYDAAKAMTENEIGSVIVTKDGRPYGMVTERDIIRAVYANDYSPRNVKLEQLVARPLIYAERGLSIEEAAEVMTKNKIRKLPIFWAGKLIGIVTITDLAMFLSPSRRPGLAKSVLQAISRGKEFQSAKSNR